MGDWQRIPEVTHLKQNYSGGIELEIEPNILLTFPREERKKLLHNEVNRILLMLDWEEQRREVADYAQSQENQETD